MFHFARFAAALCARLAAVYTAGLPHSEIAGSQVATHLPDAYRSYATSFVAFWCLGIHHSPLCPAADRTHSVSCLRQDLPTIPMLICFVPPELYARRTPCSPQEIGCFLWGRNLRKQRWRRVSDINLSSFGQLYRSPSPLTIWIHDLGPVTADSSYLEPKW
jgi:hypothetical protein